MVVADRGPWRKAMVRLNDDAELHDREGVLRKLLTDGVYALVSGAQV